MRRRLYNLLYIQPSQDSVYSLATRVPLRVDVVRDRAALSKETDEGMIENVYRLQLINKDGRAHRYTIQAHGIDDLHVVTSGAKSQPPPCRPSTFR